MTIDPADYRVKGPSRIYRTPAVSAGMVVDHLRFGAGASTLFTIDVAAGVTLLLWGWFQGVENLDLFMTFEVDGIGVGPNVNYLNPLVTDPSAWPLAISAHKAGLSAGSHTVALVADGADPTPGGITVWHVPNASFRSQVNT